MREKCKSLKNTLVNELLFSNNDCFSLAVSDSGLSLAAVAGICAAGVLLLLLAVTLCLLYRSVARKGEYLHFFAPQIWII